MSAETTPLLGGARVVVIDDDPSLLRLTQRLLAEVGIWDVHAERDVSAGVAAVLRRDPALVVLDRRLGGSDGFDVMRRLAVEDPRWSSRAVIVVTGALDSLVRDEAVALGARAVLGKPYDVDVLFATVLDLLARSDRTDRTDRTDRVATYG